MTKMHRFIVDERSKSTHPGGIETHTYLDAVGVERAAYSGCLNRLNKDMTLSEYLSSKPTLIVIDEATLDKRISDYEDDMRKGVTEIDKDRFNEMLEVLPPCSYQHNSFYVSERLSGNLVSWLVCVVDRYFETVDHATSSNIKIIKKVMESDAYNNTETKGE